MYFKGDWRISGGKDFWGSPARPNKVVLVGKGGTAERLSFCPLKGETKDTKPVTTQPADVFVRCCPKNMFYISSLLHTLF